MHTKMSKVRRHDDHETDTPAAWVARHAPGYRRARQAQAHDTQNADLDPILPTATDQAQPLANTNNQYWRPRQPERQRRNSTYKQSRSSFSHFYDFGDERSCPNMAARLPRSKPFRRIFMLLLGILALGYFSWRQAVGPELGADWNIREGFQRIFPGTFGYGQGGDYNMEENRIVTLDSSLIPGGLSDLEGKRRLIFVGDIHGCKNELIALLKECAFNQQTDHLIATGDVISKGPDSAGVVDELIRINATSVRGNHEDRILTAAGAQANEAINQERDATRHASKDSELIKSLHKRHMAFLEATPLILRIPPLPFTHALSKTQRRHAIASEILVVHAGLVPAIPLQKQDPHYVMNMRSLGRRSHTPSARPASKSDQTLPWFELWNWYHERLNRGEVVQGWHRLYTLMDASDEVQTVATKVLSMFNIGRKKPHSQTVIYGHDSRLGFVDEPWTKGLDTACVRGEQLTALILDAHGQTEIVAVPCKAYRG